MEYFAGLDVAMKETAICVVDAEGNTMIEGKALSEPDAIADFLHPFRDKLSPCVPELRRARCETASSIA